MPWRAWATARRPSRLREIRRTCDPGHEDAAHGRDEVPRAGYPEAPQVIVTTGFQEVGSAVEAMKLGAYDYITKPARIEELDVLVRKAAEKGRLIRQNVVLRDRLAPAEDYGGILTRSPRMEEILRLIDRVAPTDSTVLVLGESGTGKELVARAIHERSPRARQAFVPIHCGALPREVLESELFGHEKGAFTGAVALKPGLIELADGGTLFLDEIGEMAPDSQVRLLRVLETRTFFRVGGTRSRTVDMRLVAATNRDWPRPSAPATSGRTSTTASTPSWSPCRRCGSAGGHPALAEHFRAARGLRHEAAFRPRPCAASRVRLARQRPRAAARDRARGDPGPG